MINVIQLARKAANGRHAESDRDAHSLRFDELERFAALVLEEAAKTCDELAELSRESETDSMWQHGECAAAIRSLKPKEKA